MRLDIAERLLPDLPSPAWRIKRIRGDAETRFQRYVYPEPMSGCHLWAGGLLPTGYGIFWFSEDNPAARAHVVAWEFANGPVPDGLDVCHACDVRCCVNIDHLYVGTRKKNMEDAVVRGRTNRGEGRPLAKLTADDVAAIRASTLSSYEIAPLYGVSSGNIRRIRRRQNWRHV